MTNYVWTVSAGGTITAGGTSSSSTVTVTWNSAGAQTVTVNYTNSYGCNASTATVYNVTVNPSPVPVIYGNVSLCVNSGVHNYTTEPGMTGYVWTVSSGGTITGGQGTYQVQVTWNTPGSQSVSVTYVNTFGCSPITPTILYITVNPLPGDAGEIVGPTEICGGEQSVPYTTTPVSDAMFYVWSVPPGATIASGAGTTDITVNYGPYATSGNVTVYGDNTCGNGVASFLAITVTPIPDPADTIMGPTGVCQGTSGVVYTVPPIANASDYSWSVPAGTTITAGAHTPSITVDFGGNAVSGNVSVYGIDSCGNGLPSSLYVTVYPTPDAPEIQLNGNTLMSNTANGNQWYYQGTPISGATEQTYSPKFSGWYWDVIILNGCYSDTSNNIYFIVTSTDELQEENFVIYPVPNNGQFTVSLNWPANEDFTITVYNTLGARVYESKVLVSQGKTEMQFNIPPASTGVYTVILHNTDKRIIRKMLVIK